MRSAEDEARRELAALDRMDTAGLKARFEELFGFAPRAANPDTMRMRAAYRIQENLLGGLSREAREYLDSLADGDPLAGMEPAEEAKPVRSRGVRYVREWKGVVHEALALGDGKFEYNGEVYRSLTAIAGKITGTHWNGKRFFGVD